MTLRMVFDCESIGLHGQTWAVGYVVLDEDSIVEEAWAYCPPTLCSGSPDGYDWIKTNCPWGEKGLSEGVRQALKLPPGTRLMRGSDVSDWFWSRWIDHSKKGGEIWADVPWPVEARFLNSCVESRRSWRNETSRENIEKFVNGEVDSLVLPPSDREFKGPFPLLDVRTALEVTGTQRAFPPDEQALWHHPLFDARWSAASLLKALGS